MKAQRAAHACIHFSADFFSLSHLIVCVLAIVEYMNIYAIQILCRHKWLTLPARAVWLSVNIYFVYVCVCVWCMKRTIKIFSLAFICLKREKCIVLYFLGVNSIYCWLDICFNSNLLIPLQIDSFCLSQNLCARHTHTNACTVQLGKSWIPLNG